MFHFLTLGSRPVVSRGLLRELDPTSVEDSLHDLGAGCPALHGGSVDVKGLILHRPGRALSALLALWKELAPRLS